ncbi:MAG: hypothetical protein A3E02_00840 [Candidatus Zambryskibacteria bacterium RIFCSPHIGHO2_12_FULL_38_34]|uniref:UDP-glucose/GDP-mannose dehydrogenase dimerisation domain-containing protein n=1 Tax=Candidatus Zambryskibacteria bacterium RIFCSPLOWO2_12_FULL_39_16 TaxID=1802775 RepID=A0A1G2UQU2_9BACT|nr:MAG: hypothetical protein A3D37_01405 [Candidatus Zambryskibacteria bacterium RIFCSPHIGHO2_02_FULL_38_22]OHA97343.1 MAG: hypothetical protein A3E02_00840 [Candidatus Zambryskibacteria bacterium RIFCSPHIGHO2_12_FULL_38_34]OHB11755.1 MAG: hypothetical protein A3G46_01425 [Candidatus Zambryskibacteria bacterium RIFCSPLOWO2_12_FULL_39_16]
MKIVIIGYGWVGQANALALTLMGEKVYYYDIQAYKPHYSSRYSAVYGRVTSLSSPLGQDSENTCYLVCVGDRTLPSGQQDISAIKSALTSLSETKGTVILRSTVLPESLKSLKFDFYIPEFLHEKKAVEECIEPHFFVIGERIKDSKQPPFFKKWSRSAHKVFRGTPEEASYIKYLSNIWNATQIAFVNEFGDSIKKPATREDVDASKKIIDFVLGGGSYVRYGKSFGGHCLPKDISAFIYKQKQKGFEASIISGIKESNGLHEQLQKTHNVLPEWYSEWQLPEISLVTSLKIIARILYRKIFYLFK